MKRALFTISAGTHERQLLATDPAQPLTWLLGNDKAIADADTVLIQRNKDLVDLTIKAAMKPPAEVPEPRAATANPVPPPEVKKDTRSAKKTKGSGGELSNADAMERLDITQTKLRNLKYVGTLEGGSYGHVTLASIEAYEKRADKATGARIATKAVKRIAKKLDRVPANAPEKKSTKPAPDAAKNEPTPTGGTDRYLRIDKVAAQLGMTEEHVAFVKKQGDIMGGFGWVNFTQLQTYMASAEYVAP